MSEEKIMTLHPQGKNGVNISKAKYDQIKNYILAILNKRKVITYDELSKLAVAELTDSFKGSVIWYVVTVKLDLEAREVIERVPKTSPHQLMITKK